MTSPADSRHALPTTYVVQDQSNRDEIQRLACQDHLLTVGMGGVLPEQADPARFHRVLDVGCGTGGWLIELAKTSPQASLLVGVDANAHLIEHARAHADQQGVSDRVEFHRMDALRMLEFPHASFDLVNHRFAGSWLRTWEWRKLLQEYQRVCRPAGIIRITEANFHVRTTSPALEQLFALLVSAFSQAGHLFEPEGASLLTHLVPLLQRAGLHPIQTRALTVEYRHATPQWHAFAEDMRRAFRTMVPFLHKWTRLPDDYDALYDQARADMERPDFVGHLELATVWG